MLGSRVGGALRSDCNDRIGRVGEELGKRTLVGRFGKLYCLGKPIRSLSGPLKIGSGSVIRDLGVLG